MNEAKEFLLKELQPNQTIIIATSGGPDSMALLHLTNTFKEKLNLKIICAHVNHKLRAESTQEEAMVKQYCEKNGVFCEIMTIDHYENTNIENQARTKRYKFFKEIVNKCQANYLLTAHHGDDLIETILMRLTRGSSLTGYQGFKEKIKKETYTILRPLIKTTKEEILNYCQNNNIPYALDKTNEEDTYTRNRYRKYILPKLKEEDKNVHQKFYKFSKTLEMYQNYINKETMKYQKEVYQNHTLNIQKFNQLEETIQIEIIKNILQKTYQNHIDLINDNHIKQIKKLINTTKPNQTLNLPKNQIAIKSYNKFQIKKQEIPKPYNLKLQEINHLPNNKTIKITKTSHDTSNTTTYLNTKELNLPLYIRTRNPKDKVEIKGLNGSKKIKDIFIDEKIPLEQRNQWPIITDSQNNIIWVPGLKKTKFDKQKEGNYDIILEYI